MSNPRSSEQALSNLTIGGDNSTGAFAPAVQVAAARGAFFRKPGVTKADVVNDAQNITVSTISTALVTEASTARAAELVLTQNLSTESSLARVNEANLSNAIVSEASYARSSEVLLTQNLSTEVVNRTNAVSTCLSTANAYTDTKIGDLINNAPGVLDTLKELADALGGDQNFATTMLNNYSTLSITISNEVVRAGSYETVLSTTISTEVADRTAAVSTETSRAVAAEASLTTRVSTEESAARSAELSLGTAVSSEATTARNAEASLSTRVSAETSRATAAELVLTQNLSSELVARASGDLSLETRFSTEVSIEIVRAGVAELSLGTAVSAEATTARAAELSLENRFSTAVFDEASTARSAELSLTMRVSIEETTRATTLSSAISTEVIDRNDAISASMSATLAGANQYTDGALSTEVINRNAAISVALASANSYTDGAVSSLSTAVAQDIADLSAETSTNLSTAIATEVTSRNAAISSAVDGLSAAVSMALADEASTARSAEASLALALSNQIANSAYNISVGISSEVSSSVVFQNTSDVKFNAIQQAFDVIFDAIDIEKYQGSAPDFFNYDATVQSLGAAPATYTDIQIVDAVQGTISGGQNVSYNNNLNLTITPVNNGASPAYGLSYRVEVDGVLQATHLVNNFSIPGLYDNVSRAYTIKLINTTDNSVVVSKMFNWTSVMDNVVWTLNSNDGTNNVAPYINEAIVNYSNYTIEENNKFVFSVNKNISGITSVININAGGFTSVNGTNGVFTALESTTFDKNTNIPITLTLVNSNNTVVSTLSVNIHWVGALFIARSINYVPNAVTYFDQVTDASGNLYVVGSYNSASVVTLRNVSGNSSVNSTVTLPITSGTAGFIVKYNASGIVQWATLVDGTSADSSNSVALDSSGNVYITGNYVSTSAITLRNASGNSQVNSLYTLPICSLSSGTFLIKYNSSGIVQWATHHNGSGIDVGVKVAADSLQNVYVTGKYNSASITTLNNVSGTSQTSSTVTLPITQNDAHFLIKYNSSGIVQWATVADGVNKDVSSNMAIDSLNNVYITGVIVFAGSDLTLKNASGNTQVDSSVILNGSGTAGQYGCIVKYDSNGIVQWANRIVTSVSNLSKVAIDSSDNIYVGGTYNTSGTLNNVSGNTQVSSSITLPSPSDINDGYLAKYNANGIAQWVVTQPSNITGITFDDSNNILATCTYSSGSVITLNSASGNGQVASTVTLPITGTNTGCIIKYTPNGIVKWGTITGSNTRTVNENAIISGPLDTFYILTLNNSTVNLYNVVGNNLELSSITNFTGAIIKYENIFG